MVDDLMFVRIPEPKDVKKEILESAVSIIQLQKSIDEVTMEKKQNEHHILSLKKTVSSLLRNANSVKLPKTEKTVVKEKQIKVNKSKTAKKANKVEKKTFDNKFEKDINKLQSKIQNL